jgi:hypothetical protein
MVKKVLSLDDDGQLEELQIEQLKVEVPQGRVYKRRDGLKLGRYRGTQTIVQYVEELLIKNEILACIIGKVPCTNESMLRSIKKYFPGKSKRNVSVGKWRTAYNAGTLYSMQEKPLIVSFKYNSLGYVVDDRSGKYYQYWDDCRQKCIDLRIADPRFFSQEELSAMRVAAVNDDPQFSTWNIPGEDFCEHFKEKIGKDPYKAIKWPKNFQSFKTTSIVQSL